MKRQALLIGNMDATGAQIDINNWKKYLQSGIGGAWKELEIKVLTDPSRVTLRTWLNFIKSDLNDFVLVAFAGHGNWTRSTNLYINPQDEYISESELKDLAPRQIICLDCCRGIARVPDVVNEAHLKFFSENDLDKIRTRYDRRMMQADQQQVTLYACSIGESAYCTASGGGYYTKNLLSECASLSGDEFLTVNRAHNLSAPVTTNEVKHIESKDQHPDISAVRCPSSQQLILGIRPSSYSIF